MMNLEKENLTEIDATSFEYVLTTLKMDDIKFNLNARIREIIIPCKRRT